MNRNLAIVMVGGFLIAVLVAVLVQAGLSSKKKPPPVQEEPRVQIIVASKSLTTGAVLNDTNMRWQQWPQNAVFPGAVTRKDNKKPSEMLQGRLLRPVAAGEPIVDSALVKDSAGNFVAAALGAGMRAVAIEVNAARMAGGFIGPGDFVDVILTYEKRIIVDNEAGPHVAQMVRLNIDRVATETILQNVKILAVDQVARREEGKEVRVGKTVTLEVDMKGAEMLALAREMGNISLSLRQLGDDVVAVRDYGVITDERMTNISDEVYGEIRKIENTTSQETNIVRIYNGYVMEQHSVAP